MTMTVTPQPDHVPPRVRIEIDSDSSNLFSSLQLTRDGEYVRSQPPIGATSSVLFDYEAPFGVPVTYSAMGKVAGQTTVLNETWSSLTGWTTTTGSPSISGSHLGGGGLTRQMTIPPVGRVTSQGLLAQTSGHVAVLAIGQLTLRALSTGSAQMADGEWTKINGLSSPFEVVWNQDAATIITSAGTWTKEGSVSGGAQTVAASAAGATAFVEDFVLASLAPIDFNADAFATLATTDAWLIHPTFPALSVSIDPGHHQFRDEGINVDATSASSTTRAARSTRHDLEGRRRAVVITSGPRAAAEWELRLRTRRLSDRDDIVRLVDDQSPLLLRSPASWPWDLPDDWYSVGDFSEERPRATRLDASDRVLALPLVPVDPPIVRLAPVWTYGTDLLSHPTYRRAKAALPTYLDRLVGEA